MSTRQAFKSLAFRVYMKPAPRTQSESNAILFALQDFGPVNVFQIDRRPERRLPLPGHRDAVPTGAAANLIFTNSTKSVEHLKTIREGYTLKVTANANIPDPRVQDPFNVRGLQDRKRALAPQEFECRILSIEHEDGKERRAMLRNLRKNDYTDNFYVDRGSVFGEILAKTDCPSGLIHGLLPKHEHRRRDEKNGPGAIASDEATTIELEGDEDEEVDSGVASLHSRVGEAGDVEAETDQRMESKEVLANGDTESVARSHDRYAALRDFSLMGLYHEATRVSEARKGKEEAQKASKFASFNNKS